MEDFKLLLYTSRTVFSITIMTKTSPLAPLTTYDIKLIQYKDGLYKVQEINRIIGLLEKKFQNPKLSTNDSKKPNLKGNNKIMPLLNYILNLCEGHVFNIHPLIRKQYLALCQFKFHKSQDLNIPVTTSFISSVFDFALVKKNSFEKYQLNIYDENLQWKLLNYLKKLTLQTLSLYNKKLRQIQLEKTINCNRPYEITEINSKFMIDYVEDLIRPIEMPLSLDFPVLVGDRSQNTTLSSFLKLQYQVLDKFVKHFNKKVVPRIKDYYNKINLYSNKSYPFDSLPFSEYSLHRIYALLFKSFDILSMIISIVLSVYLPNKSYFYNCKTKLMSKNVYQYEKILDKIDEISKEYTNKDFCDFRNDLDSFTENNMNHVTDNESETSTIAVLYKNFISKHIHLMKSNLNWVSKWVSVWKYIEDNIETLDKYKDYEEDQLNTMLMERRSIDKISYMEKSIEGEQKPINKNNVVNNSSSTSSSTTSPRNSSFLRYKLQPDNVRMLNSKVHQSILTSKNHVSGNITVPLSSTNNDNNRQSKDDNSENISPKIHPLSRNSSNHRNSSTNSPLGSRRPSLIVRPVIPVKIHPTVLIEPTKEQTKNDLKRTSSIKGRPRSTSLQAVMHTTTSKKYEIPILETKRSNSLEAHDALNPKLVQNTMKKSMYSDSGKRITQSNQSHNLSWSKSFNANRSRSSSVNSDSSFYLKSTTNEKKTILKNTNGINNNSSRLASPLNTKLKNDGTTSLKEKNYCYDNNGERLHFKDSTNANSTIAQTSDVLREDSDNINDGVSNNDTPINTIISASKEGSNIVKKVRFIGVPPMLPSENPKPKKQGWYKKPAVLHYPPIPPQVNITLRQKYNLEGIVFKKKLGDSTEEGRKSKLLTNLDETLLPKKSPPIHKFGITLRDKFGSF